MTNRLISAKNVCFDFVPPYDFTANTIIKIESGATYNPRVETLKKITDALGVGIDDLMKDKSQNKK